MGFLQLLPQSRDPNHLGGFLPAVIFGTGLALVRATPI
jgi:hypothetical protein